MPWRAAIQPARGGVVSAGRRKQAAAGGRGVALDVEVVPGSSAARFPAGYNAWRRRIEAKVRAPPEGGKANAELVALVASMLQVPASRVTVASGQTSRRKTLHVEGLAADEAARRLAGHFG